MKLKQLIETDLDIEITNISEDSRTIRENGIFFAIKGAKVDGNKYINSAINNGAVCVISDEYPEASVPVFHSDNIYACYNEALSKLYNESDKKIKKICVTGTDGKTTTSEIIYQLLNNFDKCGYIGTNGIKYGDEILPNEYTTPMPGVLYPTIDLLYQNGCKYLSMEASGERLGTNRLIGLNPDVAIFTNLTRDALDIFGTMDNYCAAKSKLFEMLKSDGLALINLDDEYCEVVKKACNGKIVTYSICDAAADIFATNINVEYDHLSFNIIGKFGEHHVESPLSGLFNVYNLMCAIVTLNYFGYDIEKIIDAIRNLKPIPSRQTMVPNDIGINVMVDYGHTANAFKNLYDYVRTKYNQKIITVAGAGGSRDKRRMIEMANACTDKSDYVFITIEDPRYDDPDILVEEMASEVKEAGKTNYEIVVDRDEAIRRAINKAEKGDLILIMGKGLEDYMTINGKDVPRLNDYEVAKIVLNERENIKLKELK